VNYRVQGNPHDCRSAVSPRPNSSLAANTKRRCAVVRTDGKAAVVTRRFRARRNAGLPRPPAGDAVCASAGRPSYACRARCCSALARPLRLGSAEPCFLPLKPQYRTASSELYDTNKPQYARWGWPLCRRTIAVYPNPTPPTWAGRCPANLGRPISERGRTGAWACRCRLRGFQPGRTAHRAGAGSSGA